MDVLFDDLVDVFVVVLVVLWRKSRMSGVLLWVKNC